MNDQKLWDYIDGHLNPQEMKEVDDFLKMNDEARVRLDQLKDMDSILSKQNLLQVSDDFSKEVMARIQPPSVFSLSIKGLLPYWLGFVVINIIAIVATKGEGLLPDSNSIDFASINQWFPYLDLIGLIGVGVTILYFLDKMLRRRTGKLS